MKKEFVDFIKKERVGVLAVQLLDGSPHGATMHFAYDEESFSFIFMTSPTYAKCEPLKKNELTPSSLVIGFSEEEMKTAQFDGNASLTDEDRLKEIYFKKFLEKSDEYTDDIFLVFKPDVWKYTDYNKSEGKTILNHKGEVTVIK